jgi:hypothetical protein
MSRYEEENQAALNHNRRTYGMHYERAILRMRSRNVLLLSATVRPPSGVPALIRTDPTLRLADYSKALHFYCCLVGKCFDAIVFAENSGFDLSSLQDQAYRDGVGDQVEFLSFNGLDYPASFGRGFGEFRLVDYAMTHSRVLRDTENSYVWKCTGRYIVRNIAHIVRRRPQCDLYCHMRNYAYRLCELYLMSWNATAYEQVIRGVYHQLRNDTIPGVHTNEEALFRKIVEASFQKIQVVPRFRQVPVLEGHRGWNNTHYSDRFWSPKMITRRLANRVAPWWWI